MPTAKFCPCPHCMTPLSFLEGVTGSTLSPKCPRCHEVIVVARATFLMADHSGPAPALPAVEKQT
jgi:hypothetical protein